MPPGSTSHRSSLTEGDVRRHLVRLSMPMVIGIVSIAMFNVVDTWFVGLLGARELAALSFTFPVVTIVGAISLGLGIGTTSVLSRAIGSGDTSDSRRVTMDSLLLGVVVVALFATLGLLTIDPLFLLLGARGPTLDLVRDYMSIWYLGRVFLVVPMIGNSAIRATGDTRTPAFIMVFAGLINGVLDPIFIFGLDLGVRGAAIATVVGRASTLVLSLWVLVGREKLVARPTLDLRRVWRSWREVLRVGLPTSASNLAVPLSIGVVTALLARHGEHAVAAFGAGTRVEMLAMIPSMALGAGLAPFVGQNWGAGRRDRVLAGVRTALTWSAAVGVTSFVVLSVSSSFIARSFSSEPEVVRLIALFLIIAPIGHASYGVFMCTNSTFNAAGLPSRAATLALLRAPLLAVALTWTGSALWGPTGVFIGHASANFVAGCAAGVWVLVTLCAYRAPAAVAPGG
jgi:putative MATE family efflux protein